MAPNTLTKGFFGEKFNVVEKLSSTHKSCLENYFFLENLAPFLSYYHIKRISNYLPLRGPYVLHYYLGLVEGISQPGKSEDFLFFPFPDFFFFFKFPR